MTREEHLKAVKVVGSRQVGARIMVVMLCSGPECGGAELLAHHDAHDIGVEASAHVDKMASLL